MPRHLLPLLLLLPLLCTCDRAQTTDATAATPFAIPYEKFELDNGLDVVLHVDKSDPVVAVALTAHVGSAREKEGRTGFAHLFEHLLFLESENLGKGGLDAMSARIGGSGANGSTNRDRTNYYQTVPKDALEKMIWAEADKLGWFINTVTEQVLAKEKQVVKNEKRQSVDNRPYGHNNYVIGKALYPADHPYNWQVIGSLEDLDAATLADVKEFFRRWYVPNNVTLTIAGDFDPAQAKEWVKKYFDEIPAGEEVASMEVRPAVLTETVRLYHEDNFARLPQLTLVWPGVPLYHEDAYALDVLTSYLADGKDAPLNAVLKDEKQLAPTVYAYAYGSELAGEIQVAARAFAGTPLDSVKAGIDEALARFEANGMAEADLQRILATQETSFYSGLSSVLGKGFNLAQYNIFAGDPGFVSQDIASILAVTTADVRRVYDKYIRGKPYVATSFVPKGDGALVLSGSEKAAVVEEAITAGAEEEFDASVAAEYEPAPSTFDRSAEPAYGDAPDATPPVVWESTLPNGLTVSGIESREVPLVTFRMNIAGGQLMESVDKTGAANLLAGLLEKGTRNRTPAELEAAIQRLGASINVYAGKESLVVSGSTLARNYDATMALLTEMLLEPRWDATELELLRTETLSELEEYLGEPNIVAQDAFDRLIYGEDNILAYNQLGTPESVEALTMDDLKAYYNDYLSPSLARLNVVGDLSEQQVLSGLQPLADGWERKDVQLKQWPVAAPIEQATVYFYDIPGAKQSVLNIGNPSLTATDNDYYSATVMNYILGGGGFASRLTQELRESKGYTYGIRSGFSGTKENGRFTISSSVRSNVTLESLQAIRQILDEYADTFSEQDLETTRGYLIKSNARAFETNSAKLGMLYDMGEYGMPADYVKQREAIVRGMNRQKVRQLAEQYLQPEKMIWLVVGDARTQLPRLRKLGFGEPVLLNPGGNQDASR